jgi:hypothetical protein
VIVTRRRLLAARTLAVVADAVQLGLAPLFVEGASSPLNDVLDGVVAVAMVALVGWHWAFLPAFLAELVPVFDLVPTWTAAVLIATRHGVTPTSPASPPPQGPTPLPPG